MHCLQPNKARYNQAMYAAMLCKVEVKTRSSEVPAGAVAMNNEISMNCLPGKPSLSALAFTKHSLAGTKASYSLCKAGTKAFTKHSL
mmetsp:Transcript_6449/g.17242  ORF Transcript_6449/g.17242 Transcript_6449/m.17242 type:complete len:87 (-) Transcript_6449:6445-6705(-)